MAYLRVFGGLQLDAPEMALSARALQRKRLALLALLATVNRRLSREKLTAYLWPESDTERARHQLASSVYELRKALGEQTVQSAGDDVWLDPAELPSDITDFEAAVAAGDHERAVGSYAGPFLDGFFLPDAPEFERWADAERTRLALSYAKALEEVARKREQEGDQFAALEAWRKLAAHEPYNSRILLQLMHALDAAGDRAGALQHARAHVTLLREELGVDPPAEFVAAVEELRQPQSERAKLEPTPASRADHIANAPTVQTPRRPRRVRAAVVLGSIVFVALVVMLVTFVFGNRHSSGEAIPGAAQDTPVVVMMDSPHPARVYDDEAIRANGTNADIINDLLRDLPIQRVKETAGPFWHRDEEIRRLQPDLVLIHLSAFCSKQCEPQRVRLRQFIDYLADTDARFLIYSRMTPDSVDHHFKEMLGDLPQRHPDLPGRIHTFSLVQYGRPQWRDPATATAFKLRVKELLDLR